MIYSALTTNAYASRIIKDKMREFTHEVLLTDLKRDPQEILDNMWLISRGYIQDIIVEARRDLPEEFVLSCLSANEDNRNDYRKAVSEILLKDKINFAANAGGKDIFVDRVDVTK